MPKRLKTHRPPGHLTREEQNKRYDAQRRQEDETRKLYHTMAWRRLQPRILDRDPYCVRCLAKSPQIITPSTTVNHIKRSRDFPELFYDETNLEGVCAPCHSSDIQREERAADGRTDKGV